MNQKAKHRPTRLAVVCVGEILAKSTKPNGEYSDLTYQQIVERSKGALKKDQVVEALKVLYEAKVMETVRKSSPNRAPRRAFVQPQRDGADPVTSDLTRRGSGGNATGLSTERDGADPVDLKGSCNYFSKPETEKVARCFADRDMNEMRKPRKSEWATDDAFRDHLNLINEAVQRRAKLGLFENPNEIELWQWCIAKRHGQIVGRANLKALFPKDPCSDCADTQLIHGMDEHGDPMPPTACPTCSDN